MSVRDRVLGMVRRLSACTAVGVAMAGTAYVCAWYSMRDHRGYRGPHQRAFYTLRTLRTVLGEYQKEKGKYPEKLADLASAYPERVGVDDSGHVADPWGNPYQYRVEGESYTLFSLGRDGKRGGEGLDQDLDVRDMRPDDDPFFRLPDVGVPTLWQFTTAPSTGSVMITCALAGIFAFITCFTAQRAAGMGLPFRPIKLGMTLVACLVTAVFISAIHIPNNH
jgi:hypothetical protein